MIELSVAAHLAYTTLSLLDLRFIGDGLSGLMTWPEDMGLTILMVVEFLSLFRNYPKNR
jgi:hypothetical protein